MIDFGFSRQPNPDTGLCKTICGTPAYLSPEILNGKFQGYTKVADWWAFGCVIFELMVGRPPFCNKNHEHETPYAIYLRVLKGNISFPRKMHPPAKEIVKMLLKSEMSERLTEGRLIQQQPFLEADYAAVRAGLAIPPFIPTLREPGDRHYFIDEYNSEQVFARDEQKYQNTPTKTGKRVDMDASLFSLF